MILTFDFQSLVECVVNVFCRYLQEYSALGTGGGIYHFRDQIVAGGPEAFFIMNADVCSAFPLADMLRFQKDHGEPNSFVILGTTVRVYLHGVYWILKCSKVGFVLCQFTVPNLSYQSNRKQSMNYGCIVENEETHEVIKPK